MQPRVVLVHGLIEVLIHVREDRTGKAVGDRGDEVPAGAAARERVSCVGENFIRLRIRAVDGRAEAAHESESAVQVLLECGDVIFRERALPDLDTDLRHIVHYRDKV